ncbi:MAG: hypothetical protein ABI680_14685 [Chthoniobacteraceae bacterium]
MKRNLILTVAHRIKFPSIKPFFRSLRRTEFSGDLVVFGSGLDAETIRQIESFGGELIRFRFPGRHVSNRAARLWGLWKPLFASRLAQRNKERLAHAVFHLFYRRHLLYLDFLRAHENDYDKILLTDCRDVFFQADPFGWDQSPGLHVFLEEESNKLGTCKHHIRWLTSAYGADTLAQWRDNTVSCAGTVFGDTESIVRYLEQMVVETMKVKTLKEADGDQGIHNYLIHASLLSGITVHNNRCQPITTLGLVPKERLRFDPEGYLLDVDGAIVPVLHQYDRDKQLEARLLSQLEQKRSQPTPLGR